jgi:hypothetical protein
VFQFKEIVFSDPDEVIEEIAAINNIEKAIVCYIGLDWCAPVRWTYVRLSSTRFRSLLIARIQYLQEISDEPDYIDSLRLYILDAENEDIVCSTSHPDTLIPRKNFRRNTT